MSLELVVIARTVGTWWKRYGWWLVATLMALVGLLIYGFATIDGFGNDVVVGAVGLLASVPIWLFVVESILERRSLEAWGEVREQTGRTLEFLANEAALALHLAINEDERGSVPSPAGVPLSGIAQVLRRSAPLLRAREHEAEPDPAVLRLHNTLQRSLYYHLLDGMGPRVYASRDPELVRRFGALAHTAWDWERDRYLYEDQRLELLWTNAADTAEALADLVDHARLLASQS